MIIYTIIVGKVNNGLFPYLFRYRYLIKIGQTGQTVKGKEGKLATGR